MGDVTRERYKKRLTKKCLNCSAMFTIPPCRDWREHCCSSKCKKEYRTKKRNESMELRKRNCCVCGIVFYPRPFQIKAGQGKYCSNKCFYKVIVLMWQTDQKVIEKRTNSHRIAVDEGKYAKKSGPDNPQWTGGKVAASKRRLESGKCLIYTRMWRKKNPDKVRDQTTRRRSRCLGRLPRGTVSRIKELQKNKCAI